MFKNKVKQQESKEININIPAHAVVNETVANHTEELKEIKDILGNHKRKIDTSGDLIVNTYNTAYAMSKKVEVLGNLAKEMSEEVQERLESQHYNSLIFNNHFQREMLYMIIQSEIIEDFILFYINCSWFTKIFRKSYLRKAYGKIALSAKEKHQGQLEQCKKFDEDLKKELEEKNSKNSATEDKENQDE